MKRLSAKLLSCLIHCDLSETFDFSKHGEMAMVDGFAQVSHSYSLFVGKINSCLHKKGGGFLHQNNCPMPADVKCKSRHERKSKFSLVINCFSQVSQVLHISQFLACTAPNGGNNQPNKHFLLYCGFQPDFLISGHRI